MAEAAPNDRSTVAPDPWSIPLVELDVSRANLFGTDTQGAYFARPRKEAPVHYCARSDNGPYWSITRFHDIKHVDTHHHIFSSEAGGITISEMESDPDVQLENFIAMDPPKHDEQRKTVAPSVARAGGAAAAPRSHFDARAE